MPPSKAGGAALAGVAAAVLLAATGCGSSNRPAATGAVTTTTRAAAPATTVAPTTTESALPVAPLTGLPVSSRDVLNRPAVVVKIDNVDAARPQTGINQADVVFEQMVEGGLTRLAAVFQSQLPDPVGPIRSGRTTDEGITNNLNYPVFVYSGANADFQAELYQQPVVNVNQSNHPAVFFRGSSRPAPHNLFANATDLVKLADAGKGGPPALFDYRGAGTTSVGAGAQPVTSASVSFPSASATWTWDTKTHLWDRVQNRKPHVDSAGKQVAVANVIIQAIPYDTPLTETNGTGIPHGEMTGNGQAWVLTDGQMVQASWSRASLTATTTFTDSAHQPIRLTPGQTWVELLPVGRTPSFSS